MAKRVIDDNTLTGIAEAIREKSKTTDSLTPLQMPGAILDIKGAEVEEVTNSAGGKSVYINSEVPKLPEGFTRLKWIQSTGTQCIDTGLQPNQDTRIKMEVDILSSSTSFLFGARASSSGVRFGMAVMTGTTVRFDYATSATTLTVASPIGRYTIDMDGNSFRFGSTSGAQTAATFEVGYNLFLLAMNTAGTAGTNGTPAKLYTCQIYDNGTLVRDYVPCLNAIGVAGLYDMVNGVFYGDAAGGSFVAGPVVLEYELPEGYEELEYIQSSGSQYADTGFKPNQDTRVIIDAQLAAAIVNSNTCAYFGVRTSNLYFDLYDSDSSNQYIRYFYGTNYNKYFTLDNTARHVFDCNKNTATANGTTLTYTATTFQFAYNLYLGASNNTGKAEGMFPLKIYSCQIYDNGTLVRDYVPCKNASGTAGLYDMVNSVFYADAAGAGFIAGPVVGKGVSKVVLEDQVLIDLTQDTISPETVLAGFIGHDKTGAQFVGELVQKAGGRPVATGMFTPSSTTTSMVISGLDFQAKVVAVFKGSTGVTTGIVMDALVDTEIGIGFVDWAQYDYSYWLVVAQRTWSAANVKISTTTTGFTFSVPTTVPFGTQPYYWYAIG